jgi:hypothetical protein
VYPIALFSFFLLKLLVPFSPFSHWYVGPACARRCIAKPLALFAVAGFKPWLEFAQVHVCFRNHAVPNRRYSRSELLESVYNVAIAPFGRIRFRDVFCGVWLTSVVKVKLHDFDFAAGRLLRCLARRSRCWISRFADWLSVVLKQTGGGRCGVRAVLLHHR